MTETATPVPDFAAGLESYLRQHIPGLEGPMQLERIAGGQSNPTYFVTFDNRRLVVRKQPGWDLQKLDVDSIDPAFAPGTGTPEPGGLSSNQVLSLLEELAGLPFVGMDCVEVSPPYDHAELTSNAAANFVWTYLSGRCAIRPVSGTSRAGVTPQTPSSS